MDATALIAALGNPGPQYAGTRHNFGFIFAEALLAQARERKSMRLAALQSGGDCDLYGLIIGGRPCLLTKPLTFMNLSGRAVGKICGRYGIGIRDVLVVHDDLDLSLGRMKLKRGGSSGGHHGVESVAEHLSGTDFLRLRLGTGRPRFSSQVTDYVLGRFTDADQAIVAAVCENAIKGVNLLFRRGLSEAVQLVNAFRFPPSGANSADRAMDTTGRIG